MISGYNPLDTLPPSADDEIKSQELLKVLNEQNTFESDQRMEHRKHVLTRIEEIIQLWVLEIYEEKFKIKASQKLGTFAKLYTFGSYRLGVCTPLDDIDTSCICPEYVDRRADFFTRFPSRLEEQKGIELVINVPNAFVPHIKVFIEGIWMDISFANLNQASIPENLNIFDDNIFFSFDQLSLRSLNGCYVEDAIMRLVPQAETFRTSLRFVKLWARKRGIYGNIYGFLGGISWTILTAFVCILYPTASPSRIVFRFFFLYENRKWDK